MVYAQSVGCTFTYIISVFLIQNWLVRLIYSLVYSTIFSILLMMLFINHFEIEYDKEELQN